MANENSDRMPIFGVDAEKLLMMFDIENTVLANLKNFDPTTHDYQKWEHLTHYMTNGNYVLLLRYPANHHTCVVSVASDTHRSTVLRIDKSLVDLYDWAVTHGCGNGAKSWMRILGVLMTEIIISHYEDNDARLSAQVMTALGGKMTTFPDDPYIHRQQGILCHR